MIDSLGWLPHTDDMLSQISFLAFDAVGTVIYPDPPVAAVYARIARQYGIDLSEDIIQSRFPAALAQESRSQVPTNEAAEKDLWRRIVFRVLERDDVHEGFEELFAHFAQPSAWRCYPDVADTLSELKSRGYALGLASNFDRRLHAVADGLSGLREMPTRVISSEVGFAKPDARFYQALCDAAGLPPERILMVGDSWENDIEGALSLGLSPVFLNRNGNSIDHDNPSIPVISSLSELIPLLPSS